jgi:hypothetical protein
VTDCGPVLTHLSFGKDAPLPRPVDVTGRTMPFLGGLAISVSELDFRRAQPWRDLSNSRQMPSSTALASRESTVSKPSVNEP